MIVEQVPIGRQSIGPAPDNMEMLRLVRINPETKGLNNFNISRRKTAIASNTKERRRRRGVLPGECFIEARSAFDRR